MANGRCRMHGGKSTGPKNQRGNKNAVKHGQWETITLGVLEDNEKALLDDASTDPAQLLDEQILLTQIRLRRMMARLAKLQETKSGMILAEQVDSADVTEDGPANAHRTQKRVNVETMISQAEAAITSVQSALTRMLAQKREMQKEAANSEDSSPLPWVD